MKVSRFALLLCAIGIVLVGCGDDDDDESLTPAATAPVSATAAAAAYPVTVTDLLGREVEIEAEPEVIVALSPTAVEYVYAVGGTVDGRPESATYPPEVESAETVGTAYQPSLEAVLALEPDLVIADSVIHAQPQLREQLESLGVPVIFAGAESYEQVLEGLELVGTALDASEEAEAAISDIEKSLADAKTTIGDKEVSAVAMIAGRDQTLYAAKSSSYIGDVLAQLGIENPAADGPESGPGFPGYTTLAPETLIQYDPDIIFTITPGPPSVPRLSTIIPTIPPFAGLSAVTSGNVIELDVGPALEAPGPRINELFAAIAEAAAGVEG